MSGEEHSHGKRRSGHGHHHHDVGEGDRRILIAVAVNVLLTVAQVVGGLVSGSLSLIADALHNFSDAASILIAYFARRIARRPATADMTFGYGRAEVVAAVINYTALIVIGLNLAYEAVMRLVEPSPVSGGIVIAVAAVATIIDVVTAAVIYSLSKSSMNIRAAFLHNVADALGSLGVILAGVLVLAFGWTIADPIVTLAIAGYVFWQALSGIRQPIRLLIMGVPDEIDRDAVVAAMKAVKGVADIRHIHIWAIDERRNSLEAHVVVNDDRLERLEETRIALRAVLAEQGIGHSTLEFECPSGAAEGQRDEEPG